MAMGWNSSQNIINIPLIAKLTEIARIFKGGETLDLLYIYERRQQPYFFETARAQNTKISHSDGKRSQHCVFLCQRSLHIFSVRRLSVCCLPCAGNTDRT